MIKKATPSLAAYRSFHKIVVDDSGPLPVCGLDAIRIHPTRVGGWIHDRATTDRLHRAEIRELIYGPERVSDSFAEIIIRCADDHAEGCSCRLSGVVSA